jgi:hypothetical protein
MSEQKRRIWPIVLGIVACAVVLAVVALVVYAQREKERGRRESERQREETKKTLEHVDALLDKSRLAFMDEVAAQPTFDAAISHAKPRMADTIGTRGDGAMSLLNWTTKHKLQWSDVALAKDETSVGLANKNIDEARGKRLCAHGALASIEASQLIGTPYVGLMGANGGALQFVAVRGTGDLVALSSATFCGVVTGKFNNIVQVVGMFDLPENRK